MRRIGEWFIRDWSLKLAALGLAVLLWSLVKSDELTTVVVPAVPVRVSLRDPAWELAGPPTPQEVSVSFTGPVREVARLATERPRIVVPVEEVQDSVDVTVLRSGWVQVSGALSRTRVDDVRPSTVRLVFDRVDARLVPLSLPMRGKLPAGRALTGRVVMEPAFVRVSGPARRLARLDSIRLPALDLAHLRDTTTLRIGVDTADLGLLVAPLHVRVTVPVGLADSTSAPVAADGALTSGHP
ncbi:MAG TPA: YbbR-like domain-containing protein [Longimicrobiales bacterium]|nr:YbbR-like domain-containing protein [Longimicrobiales bacterium]